MHKKEKEPWHKVGLVVHGMLSVKCATIMSHSYKKTLEFVAEKRMCAPCMYAKLLSERGVLNILAVVCLWWKLMLCRLFRLFWAPGMISPMWVC